MVSHAKFTWDWQWPEEILQGPAYPPPNGVFDFDAPRPYNNHAYALITVCVTLTTIGAMLRIYARVFITKKVHIEDYLALFVLVPYAIFIWAFIKYIQLGGLFVHQWNVRAGTMFDLSVYLFVFTIVDSVLIISAKAAILLEWKRIFMPRGTGKIYSWAVWFLLAFNTLFYFIITFFIVFSVRPVPKNWNVLLPGSLVFNRKSIEIVAAAFNIFVDIGIMLLPQSIIWNLNMTRARKLGLTFMFSLGLLSTACSAGRLHAMIYMEYAWPEIGDTSWRVSYVWLWWMGEMTSINVLLAAPSVPRAFADSGFLGRMVLSLRSWTGVVSSKSSEVVSKSWPRTFGSASTNDRSHRLADEEGPVLGLADLQYMQKRGSLDPDNSNLWHSSRITKTIQLEQEDEAASKSSLDPTLHRQHPWREV